MRSVPRCGTCATRIRPCTSPPGEPSAPPAPQGVTHVLAALGDPATVRGRHRGGAAPRSAGRDRAGDRLRARGGDAGEERSSAHRVDPGGAGRGGAPPGGGPGSGPRTWHGPRSGRRACSPPGRPAMTAAIERLDGPAPLRASALETLETRRAPPSSSARCSRSGSPSPRRGATTARWLAEALQDDDGLVQRCAELVRARREGDTMTSSLTTISVIERVLILRRVPLFAD